MKISHIGFSKAGVLEDENGVRISENTLVFLYKTNKGYRGVSSPSHLGIKQFTWFFDCSLQALKSFKLKNIHKIKSLTNIYKLL